MGILLIELPQPNNCSIAGHSRPAAGFQPTLSRHAECLAAKQRHHSIGSQLRWLQLLSSASLQSSAIWPTGVAPVTQDTWTPLG